MAVDRIDRPIAPTPAVGTTRESLRTAARRDTGTAQVVALVRSLLMLALAALAILGLLPMVVAAQAAASL
jgi:hypothetical protein